MIGDAATIEELLLAGANPHIKDKVWESTITLTFSSEPTYIVHFSFTAWCFYFIGRFFSLLVKNGVTAMEITEQRAQYGLESETLAMGEMMSQVCML